MKIQRRTSIHASSSAEQKQPPLAEQEAYNGPSNQSPNDEPKPDIGVDSPVSASVTSATPTKAPNPKRVEKPASISARLIVGVVFGLGLAASAVIGGFQIKSYLDNSEAAAIAAQKTAAQKTAAEKAKVEEAAANEASTSRQEKVKAEQEAEAQIQEERRVASELEEKEEAEAGTTTDIRNQKSVDSALDNKRSSSAPASRSPSQTTQVNKPKPQAQQPPAPQASPQSKKSWGVEVTTPNRPRPNNPNLTGNGDQKTPATGPSSGADQEGAAKESATKKINEIRKSMGLPPI